MYVFVCYTVLFYIHANTHTTLVADNLVERFFSVKAAIPEVSAPAWRKKIQAPV